MVTLAAALKAIVTATSRISTYCMAEPNAGCMAEPNAGALMKVPNGARALRLWQGVRSPGQARRSGRARPCPGCRDRRRPPWRDGQPGQRHACRFRCPGPANRFLHPGSLGSTSRAEGSTYTQAWLPSPWFAALVLLFRGDAGDVASVRNQRRGQIAASRSWGHFKICALNRVFVDK
jgi:hypothetical protein